ncbi:MAG: protein BatD [Saprospiraceae bacterium]|uniref:Protein BatD n=1 Tax=Candidatus Opimibacter skivensis TaxID=2982028 RepID=A0A9D7XVK3_9BACT|nr:protein BatD [Candidatus Opimibacter skivensis]
MRKKSFNLLFAYLTCLVVFCCVENSHAQDPVFAAAVASDKVAQNTVFDITFELRNAQGGNFQPPTFENFKVVAGPSTSSSTMIMNGQMSQSISWSYSLLAVQVGKFTIGSAKVAAGRKQLSTRPLTIEVVKSKTNSGSGITATGKENVLLVASLDTTSYYPGQQIILQYKLLFNQNVQSVNVLSEDDYADFFIQNFGNFNRQSTMENVNGVHYTSRVIKAIALFAHQSGTYTIDPMIMDVGLEAPFPEQRGFFSMRSMDVTKASSAPLTVHILPLPPGAPSAFSGAVGHYSVKGSPGQTDITTDDAFTISVEIKGDGDGKRWDPPTPVADGDFEIYDPRIIEDKMTDDQDHITHHRTIEYQMIPREPGHYKVVVPLIYFNPRTLKYETASTDTVRLNVTQGANSGKKTTITAAPEIPNQLRKIRNITTDDRFWMSIPHLFLFGLILSGSFWGMFVSFKRKREDAIPEDEKIRIAAVRNARLQIDALQMSSSNFSDKEFFERATELFYKFLSDKLSIPPSELDQGKLQFYLDKSGVADLVKTRVSVFFEQCLSVRYGAIPGGKSREQMLMEIRSFVDVL